jgi:DNA-binding NarL/FixJ family response regulator
MKVLVVDDDRLVSSSLKTILEAGGVEVAGTLNSGEQAAEQYETLRPDVLLMDIRMKDITGLEVAEAILKRHPDAKILFLTTFSDDEYIAKALQLGAKGYILKQDFESIVPSVKAVYLGQRVFGDEIVSRLPAMKGGAKPDLGEYGLNGREQELLTQVASGLSNREIAEKLFLSEGTVRNYISALLEKLGLRSRTQLAIFYYQHQ